MTSDRTGPALADSTTRTLCETENVEAVRIVMKAGMEISEHEAPGEINRSAVLLIDAIINLVLGALLLIFPQPIVVALGVPQADTPFYPSILGSVLFGSGIALVVEWRRRPSGLNGLGLGGAIAINLCGGIVLAGWLLLGGLDVPLRGRVFLWGLAAVLLVVVDLYHCIKAV